MSCWSIEVTSVPLAKSFSMAMTRFISTKTNFFVVGFHVDLEIGNWFKKPKGFVCFTVDASEIPNNHLGCIKTVVNNGINYQPDF